MQVDLGNFYNVKNWLEQRPNSEACDLKRCRLLRNIANLRPIVDFFHTTIEKAWPLRSCAPLQGRPSKRAQWDSSRLQFKALYQRGESTVSAQQSSYPQTKVGLDLHWLMQIHEISFSQSGYVRLNSCSTKADCGAWLCWLCGYPVP